MVFTKAIQCLESVGAVGDLTIGGKSTFTGKATCNVDVDIKGNLDSKTVKNAAIEAKDAAAAASKTERDKLEKDIKKTIKDNESVIRRNKNLVDSLMKQRG